jgi:hypothetical protein
MIKYLGLILIVISITVFLVSIFRKQGGFINLGESIKKHLLLFSSCKTQYLLFYFMPFLLSFGLALIFQVTVEFCENINVVISIILSMLFAICGIIGTKDYATIMLRQKKDTVDNVSTMSIEATYAKVKTVAEETLNAIIFTTMLALILISVSLGSLLSNVFTFSSVVVFIDSVLIYYLLSVVLVTMMLIIKRMQRLFSIML